MIHEVYFKKFKQFKEKRIALDTESLSLIAGPNNSGKSSLLHGLAVWEYCKLIINTEKGFNNLINVNNQGIGISAEEFLPIAIPTLKHLWTNLKSQKETNETDGYTLKIGCKWFSPNTEEKYLEFSLSLSNDRLFIKTTDTNLKNDDYIPVIAYLPPFGGMVAREGRLSQAERRQQIGKGMAGSVLRNIILELKQNRDHEKEKLRNENGEFRRSELKRFNKENSFQLLQDTLRNVFGYQLKVFDFNELYHTSIHVHCDKVRFTNNQYYKVKGFNSRDVMVQGSGFLQWLNVYSLAVNEGIDVLLLDEPDAHLHPSLQETLINYLEDIRKKKGKQIFLATHSSELIKSFNPASILALKGDNRIQYLNTDGQKQAILEGLGSEYAPKIEKAKRTGKILFVENQSDEMLLKKWANVLGFQWPKNIAVWYNRDNHNIRKSLFLALKSDLSENLEAISLRDLDNYEPNCVDDELNEKNFNHSDGFVAKTWKRREIENYLIYPAAISRASGCSTQYVNSLLNEHAISIPDTFQNSETADNIHRGDIKKIFYGADRSIENVLNVSRFDVAESMEENEICKDVKYMLNRIGEFSNGLLT